VRPQQSPPGAGRLLRDAQRVEGLDPDGQGILVIAARREQARLVPIDLRLGAADRQDGAAVLAGYRQGAARGSRGLGRIEKRGAPAAGDSPRASTTGVSMVTN